MKATMMVLIIALAQIPASGQQHKESINTQDTYKAEANKPTPLPPPPVIINETVNRHPSRYNRESQTGDPPKKSHDGWDLLYYISTVIMALFTIVAAVAVIWQVKTSHQTERAWISVKIRTDNKTTYLGLLSGIPSARIQCEIINRGRTPARIVELRVAPKQMPEKEELPLVPNFNNIESKPMNKLFLSPEESIIETFITHLDWFAINKGTLYVYGYVDYIDAFNRKHQSRFCYACWRPHVPELGHPASLTFIRGGPTSYNSAT